MSKRQTLAGALLAGALAIPVTADAAGPPLRLLPLGDSITQGHRIQRSYRYALWRKLLDAGIDTDFVGSLDGAFDGDPDWPDYRGRAFDRDHEGHWGWRVDEILQGRGAAGGLADWLRRYTPDLVLLHLGSNDAAQGQPAAETAAELERVIALLRADNPRVAVLLARLIPFGHPRVAPAIVVMNAAIDDIARRLDRPDSRVVIVDQYSGFTPRADTYDGIHPNRRGVAKMAQRWFDAIARYRDGAL